ncbi:MULTISPECIES: alpha/beta family hydrolase [unclassified Streptomyces]|uniref:alpha/beta hydrolase family protein n=1 Tax=unclassified Streptomyces TaxID=2593676 RepID=UPI00381A6360
MGRVTTDTRTVDTPAGDARITWHPAPHPRLVLALGHGAGGGIEARDLRALAAALPPLGVTVALVEQPWRVAGKKVAPAPATLDTGWRALWPALAGREPGLGLVAGGRSAGARVACRTARELGARAVLALSFPLHPPGRPEKSRAAELLGSGVPTLVVQGGNDPFGKPAEFPAPSEPRKSSASRKPSESGKSSVSLESSVSLKSSGAGYGLLEVPYGDHSFAVPKRAPLGQDEALETITGGVAAWLDGLDPA